MSRRRTDADAGVGRVTGQVGPREAFKTVVAVIGYCILVVAVMATVMFMTFTVAS